MANNAGGKGHAYNGAKKRTREGYKKRGQLRINKLRRIEHQLLQLSEVEQRLGDQVSGAFMAQVHFLRERLKYWQ